MCDSRSRLTVQLVVLHRLGLEQLLEVWLTVQGGVVALVGLHAARRPYNIYKTQTIPTQSIIVKKKYSISVPSARISSIYVSPQARVADWIRSFPVVNSFIMSDILPTARIPVGMWTCGEFYE